MLNLTSQQRLIPDTYTCELTYEGQVLTTEYEITVVSTTGENSPASEVVTLVRPEDLVFRSTGSTWVTDTRYVFTDSQSEGTVHIMDIKMVDGKPVITAQNGAVFAIEGSDYTYLSVSDPDLLWKTQSSVNTSGGESVEPNSNLFLKHEQSGDFLFVDEGFHLRMVDSDTLATLPNGWRLSAGKLIYSVDQYPPYAEVYYENGTFAARSRSDGANIALAFVLEDQVNTRLAYADALIGSCTTGAVVSTECGGNVVIKTLLEDGSTQVKIVPITIDMLSVDYTQLLVPGTYTCTLTYEGKVISQDYSLTVQPAEG